MDFTGFDNKNIHVLTWEGGTRGVVQIVHGMAEHAARYDAFARF